jgi:hypothetical protein
MNTARTLVEPVDDSSGKKSGFFIHRLSFQSSVFDPISKEGEHVDPSTHFKVIPLRALSY